jgi:hypothetical protein
MSARIKFLVVIAVSSALLASRTVPAMEIQEFEKMATDDQNAYIGDLVWGAIKILEEDCKPELAAQVRKLFLHDLNLTDSNPIEGTLSLGYGLIRASERAAKHPGVPRLHVEEVMRATLSEKGITLPDRFMTVDSAFKPKLPLIGKGGDGDAGFGNFDPADEATPIVVIAILQDDLDLRNTSEIAAGTRTQGRCKDPARSADDPIGDGGFITPPVGYPQN